jgi:hypothetical protein
MSPKDGIPHSFSSICGAKYVGSMKHHVGRPEPVPFCDSRHNNVCTSDDTARLPPRLCTDLSFSRSNADKEPSLNEFVALALGRGE